MNRNYWVFIFALFVWFSCQAQNDYVKYNLQCYSARKLAYEENLDSALKVFIRAFKLVDYVHTDNLEKAQEIAQIVGGKQLHDSITNSLDIRKQRLEIIDDYKNQIDSLFDEDRRVRSKEYFHAKNIYYKALKDSTKSHSSIEFVTSKELMQDWWHTDSSNILMLLKLIKTYGFPGERVVGRESYSHSITILVHFDNDTNNQTLSPILDNALRNGDILPDDYAWIIDRREKIPYYYHIPLGIENLSSEEIEQINLRRNKIGLRDLFEGIDIIKTDKFTRVQNKY